MKYYAQFIDEKLEVEKAPPTKSISWKAAKANFECRQPELENVCLEPLHSAACHQ